MTNPLRIAAVIPVYRRPRLIREAMDSVLAQTRPPVRLVVVDDGSPDDTAESAETWVREASPGFPVEVVRAPHGGAGAARNAGAARTGDCDALAFLDSDDLWRPEFLERTGAALAAAPGSVAAAADKAVEDDAGRRLRVDTMERYERDATRELFCNGPSGTSNTLVRAADFRAVGGFDPRIATGQDLHLMLRLSLRGRWLHVPQVLCTYRTRAGRRRGEEPPLSERYVDRRFRRVRYLDRFVTKQGGADALPARIWRPRLSHRWVRAARQLLALDRVAEARAGLQRACELCPYNPRAWFERARLAVRTAVGGR